MLIFSENFIKWAREYKGEKENYKESSIFTIDAAKVENLFLVEELIRLMTARNVNLLCHHRRYPAIQCLWQHIPVNLQPLTA